MTTAIHGYADTKQIAFMREHGLRSMENLQWFANENGYTRREVELAIIDRLIPIQMFRLYKKFIEKNCLDKDCN